MLKEREDERQLEIKVKSIITHETHLQTEMIKIQNEMQRAYYADTKAIKKLQFTVLHNSRYWSRKSWRIQVLNEYMASMKVAVNLAYGGQIDMYAAAEIHANLGMKGASPIKYQALEHDNDHFYLKMYFDIGAYTSFDRTYRNDSSSLIQTVSRLYLVSDRFIDGSPLSMAEVRVVKGIKEGCLTMIHITLYSYKVLTTGNITCFLFGKGRILYNMEKGDVLHLEGRDYCRNECIEVGFRGYTNRHKDLPVQPTVQPATLKQFFAETDLENMPSPMNMLEKAHQVSHDMLAADIRENEDLLMQLNTAPLEPFSQAGTYAGYVGALISVVLCIVFIGMCIQCKKRKKNKNLVKMKTFREIRDNDKEEEEEEL
jgi:hypothetical protein